MHTKLIVEREQAIVRGRDRLREKDKASERVENQFDVSVRIYQYNFCSYHGLSVKRTEKKLRRKGNNNNNNKKSSANHLLAYFSRMILFIVGVEALCVRACALACSLDRSVSFEKKRETGK